jgi:hypothetical protein
LLTVLRDLPATGRRRPTWSDRVLREELAHLPAQWPCRVIAYNRRMTKAGEAVLAKALRLDVKARAELKSEVLEVPVDRCGRDKGQRSAPGKPSNQPRHDQNPVANFEHGERLAGLKGRRLPSQGGEPVCAPASTRRARQSDTRNFQSGRD